MSYINMPKRHKPHRTVQDVVTPMTMYVDNGATGNFAFPCWYSNIKPPRRIHHHNRPLHDHYGWPSPRHHDHICQHHDLDCNGCDLGYHDIFNSGGCGKHCKSFIDMRKLWPIHLTEEGYTSAEIIFDDVIPGVTAHAWIDEEDDWVVRVYVDVLTPSAIDEKVSTRFRLFVNRVDENGRDVRDIVIKGKFVIFPGPIPE